ncbi:MAG: LuxR C-terminal-related transcriptional regulator [Anaerolineae bacterium]|nr:LuxR C-terminal-related transcriptional regulator [Anaerolineae bacterium]
MPALLRTKIQVPPLRSGYVTRERIPAQIEADPTTLLVLVSAPAGFGKSTALIQWAHGLQEKGVLIAWYALDERDNDPARFSAYLLETFRRHDAIFSSLSDHDEHTHLQDAVDQILNAVNAAEAPTVLILDDYHLITEPGIHDAIGRMVDHMPPNMRLAIGTRADPPLQLARLRVRGGITEIRMHDLRFNTHEMHSWLSTSLGWNPTRNTVTELERTTEGWAAALTLILMSQPHANDTGLMQQLARFSQSRRQLFDYFAQEILDRQPEHLRNFLLDTCVLNQLTPDLCQTVTGPSNAPLLLNQLAAQSLFVIPLSDTELIYRYHHLFADFLRQYLEMKDRSYYLEQHRRAARWFAAQEQVVEAVQYALAGQDYDYAAALITDWAWAALTAHGEIMTVVRWLELFPHDQLEQHPRLCLYFSRALYLTGDAERSQDYVQLASDALNKHSNQFAEKEALQAISANYQATLAAYRGEVSTAVRWIEQAADLRDAVDELDQVRIANTSAFIRYLIGDVPSARQAYESALELARQVDHPYLTLDAHSYLAQIDLLAGESTFVQERCEQVLAKYSQKIPPLSTIMVPLAQVHYERNQIVEAEALLREAISLARRGNIPDILWSAFVSLANVMLARNDIEEAEASIAQAWGFARGFQSPMMIGIIAAAEARLKLRSNQVGAAVEWAEQYAQAEPASYHQDFENLTMARVWLAQDDYSRALSLLSTIVAEADAADRYGSVMNAEILRAAAYQRAGNGTAALEAIEHVLVPARAQGIVRPLLDEGPFMLNLLRDAIQQDVVADYAAYLLDIATSMERSQHPADLLTEREIEVLRHIATGASNNDIADVLVLSLGTVKSHIHHIMNKLDAQNRTEAVNRARSLNILSD